MGACNSVTKPQTVSTSIQKRVAYILGYLIILLGRPFANWACPITYPRPPRKDRNCCV